MGWVVRCLLRERTRIDLRGADMVFVEFCLGWFGGEAKVNVWMGWTPWCG